MPVVTIVPRDETVERSLVNKWEELHAGVKARICAVSGFPEDDILVHLARCPYVFADPLAADLVLYADTCPHQDLESKSNQLSEELATVLEESGFSNKGSEVWIRFLPGSWCMTREGQIVDKVTHPRKKQTSPEKEERDRNVLFPDFPMEPGKFVNLFLARKYWWVKHQIDSATAGMLAEGIMIDSTFPQRIVLEREQITADRVVNMTQEELLSIEGIGKLRISTLLRWQEDQRVRLRL